MNKARWDERLQCCYISAQYDPVQCVGTLIVSEHHCTDMTGAIRFFWDIDRQVMVVLVRDERGILVNRYLRNALQGEWRSVNALGQPLNNSGPSDDVIKHHDEWREEFYRRVLNSDLTQTEDGRLQFTERKA